MVLRRLILRKAEEAKRTTTWAPYRVQCPCLQCQNQPRWIPPNFPSVDMGTLSKTVRFSLYPSHWVQIAEINWESYGLRVPTGGAETITNYDSRRHFRLTLLLHLFEIYLECWQYLECALNKGNWLCPSVSLLEIFMQESKESGRTENVTSSYSTCCQRPFAWLPFVRI